MEKYYPISLSLSNETCVIIGFGSVGKRKFEGLLETNVKAIKIFDAKIQEEKKNVSETFISFFSRAWQKEDLLGARLVFACTDSVEENARIAVFCQEHGILCNAASTPEKGSFHVPSVIRKDSICLTLATGGKSPALTRAWARELDEWLQKRLPLLDFMAHLRINVLELGKDSAWNAEILRRFADGCLEEFVLKRETEKMRAFLQKELPSPLQGHIETYLRDLGCKSPRLSKHAQ